MTFARHSWPLSNEVYLTCHTHCDTVPQFIMVISEDPWHSHLLPSVWQWSSQYLFLRLRSVAVGIRTSNFPLAGRTLELTAPPRPAMIVMQCWSMIMYKTFLITSWNTICLLFNMSTLKQFSHFSFSNMPGDYLSYRFPKLCIL